MKFSCDDCGAQYMIADEKIGPRGVKVRCKKCANVIILRPSKGPATTVSAPPDAVLKRPSLTPEDDDEATVSVDTGGARKAASRSPSIDLTATATLGVSSDLGLSEEFAAQGFDSPKTQPARAPTLNVGLDVAKVVETQQPSSPFLASSVGGSLRASALDAPAGLGSSAEDNEPKTSVDEMPGLGTAGLPAPAANKEVATRVAPVHIPAEARRPPDDEVSSETRAPPARFMSATVPGDPPVSLGPAPEEGPTHEVDASMLAGSIKLPGLPKLVATEASEESAVARSIEDNLDRLRLSAEGEDDLTIDSSESDPSRLSLDLPVPSAPSEGLGALARELDFDTGSLGNGFLHQNGSNDAPQEDQELPRVALDREPSRPVAIAARASSAVVVAPATAGGSLGAAAAGGESLEEEIGSAFESVFGAGAGVLADRDPFDALVRDSGPPGNGHAEVDDKKPTRVFDTDAMKRLQDEQDLASQAEVPPPEAEPVKEWYVAVNDEQVGPLSIPEVKERWDGGVVDANSLCWKAGMADWIAIRFVRELELLTNPARRGTTGIGPPPVDADALAPKPREGSAVASSRPTPAETPAEDTVPSPLGAAAVDDAVAESHESSWRPSAASALASLAAAEIESSGQDVAVGPAMPAERPSLEPQPLAVTTQPLSASMFGAAEQTSRSGRSLPKAPEIASSVPLRDPVVARGTPGWLMPALIAGGVLLLAVLGLLIVVLTRSPDPQPPVQIAVAPPAAPAPSPAPAPAPAPAPQEAAPAPTAPPTEAAPPVPAEAPPAAGAQEPAAEVRPEKKKRRDRSERAERTEREPREKRREVEAAPPPPPPPKTDLGADDLLNDPSIKRRAPAPAESDVPESLDEAQILRVLRKYKGEINACREKQAKADPNLEGVMTVKFVVQRSGQTSQHSVGPDKFKSSVVGKCVIDSVRGWRFPQFSKGTMPLDFPVMVKGRG
jgi:predicted Zn finger-like uncharacterized protein